MVLVNRAIAFGDRLCHQRQLSLFIANDSTFECNPEWLIKMDQNLSRCACKL